MILRRDILRLLKLEEHSRKRGFNGQERKERNRLWIICVPPELRWLTQNIGERKDLPAEEPAGIKIISRMASLWLTRPRDTSSLLPPLETKVAEFVNEYIADPTRPPVSPVYPCDVWCDEIGPSEIVGEIPKWDEICMYYGPAASEAAIKKALKDRLGKKGRRPRKEEIAAREAMKAYYPSRHRPKSTLGQDRNRYWFAIGERLIEGGWSKLAANHFIRLYIDTRASQAAIQKVLDTLPWPNIRVE